MKRGVRDSSLFSLSLSLTVRDSTGDGIGETAYKLSVDNNVLVEDMFETGGTRSNEFTFDPSQYTTEPPTGSPTPVPEAGEASPTSSPTEEPENSARDSSASRYAILGFAGAKGLTFLAVVSLWLRN